MVDPEMAETVESNISAFVANLAFEDLPDDSIHTVERAFADTVGVILAGAGDPPPRLASTLVPSASLPDDVVSLLGGRSTAAIPSVGLVLATAAHALDYDDSSWGIHGHPSAPLVATVLSLAAVTDVSGTDAVTAYIAGFETESNVAEPIRAEHYERGWHATATLGTFGAAASAANLLDLDIEDTEHALNMAASMASGLKRNFGSMTKPLHAGLAARSGITAALLASEGFTAGEATIGGDRGFWDLYADGPREGDVEIGDRWFIVEKGIIVKKYPCCRATHSSIAAAEAIVAEEDLDPDDIDAVEVLAAQNAADILVHEDPSTGLEGKFSMHYTVASALAHGDVRLSTFEDEAVSDPAVQAIRERVEFGVDPDLSYSSHDTTVRVHAGDRTFSRNIVKAWTPPNDILSVTDEELESKFVECATRRMSEADATRLYERLASLREESTVSDVFP